MSRSVPFGLPMAAIQPPPIPSPPTPSTAGQTQTSPASIPSASSEPEPPQSQSKKKDWSSGNLYACRDCGRSYSRPEHLVRHVQTHTLGRRFACEICSKTFARKDLLRRHVANHANDTAAKRRRVVAAAGSGRVSYACRPCAAARVKCEESKPCKRCTARGLECVLSEAGEAATQHLNSLSEKIHIVQEHFPGSTNGESSSTHDESQLPTPDTGPEQGQ